MSRRTLRAARRAPASPPTRDARATTRPRTRRRPWRLALVLALLATLGVGGNWILHQSFFSVRHAAVTGNAHESSEAVLHAAGLDAHPAMIDVRNSRVAASLRSFAWIHDVTIERDWPNKIVVHVRERRAVAVARNRRGQYDRVAEDGTDLGPCPQGVSAVRLVADGAGVWPYTAWARPAAAVASRLPLAFAGQVYAVHVTRAGVVSLQMTTPVTFVLGATSKLHAKFIAVASVIAQQKLAVGDVVDVSAPSAVTISRP